MKEDKIRVLQFMSTGNIGGQEMALFHLFSAFKTDNDIEMSAAVNSLSGYYGSKIKDLAIPIIELNMRSGFDLGFNSQNIKKLRNYHIHHLHDPSPNQIIYSLLAGRNIKRIFTRRGGIFSYPAADFKKWTKFFIKKFLLARFDAFSGNSRAAVSSIKEQYNIRNDKISLIYNGLDFKLFNPDKDPNSIYADLNIIESDFIVGTACRLVPLKRVDLILHAFSSLKIENKKLLIMGDGPERKKLEGLSVDLGCSRDVLFLGEFERVYNYLQILDAFILASNRRESFGNALIEAMYLKIPSVIFSDGGGLLDHIEHKKTGFIVNGIGELINAIEWINENPSIASELGEKASHYVQKNYSIERMKIGYSELYKSLLSPSEH